MLVNLTTPISPRVRCQLGCFRLSNGSRLVCSETGAEETVVSIRHCTFSSNMVHGSCGMGGALAVVDSQWDLASPANTTLRVEMLASTFENNQVGSRAGVKGVLAVARWQRATSKRSAHAPSVVWPELAHHGAPGALS